MIPTIDPNNHADSPIEALSPDISIQWLNGGRIVMTRIMVVRPDTYDQWDQQMRQWMAAWPTDRLFCILYDFRSPRYRFTLHAGTRMRQLQRDYGHVPYAAAIVYSDSVLARPVIATLRLIKDSALSYREYFTDYDKAMQWLNMHYQTAQAAIDHTAIAASA